MVHVCNRIVLTTDSSLVLDSVYFGLTFKVLSPPRAFPLSIDTTICALHLPSSRSFWPPVL